MFWNKKEIVKAYLPASSNVLGEETVQYSNEDIFKLIKEGYEDNPIVYRCVDLISKSLASLPLDISINGDTNITTHPVIDLLMRPNQDQARTEFLIELTSFLLITGNVYVINPNEEQDPKGKQPYMLYNINPRDVEIVGGKTGVKGYKFVNQSKYYKKDEMKQGLCGILHIKEFAGINDFYGMSRLRPCAYAIDSFNESLKWNFNLLKNLAKPSGILTSKTPMDTNQYNQAIQQLQSSWKSAKNAGAINVVNGFDYVQTSLSPVDMDFRENQIMNARYISQCFGVPAQLIGLPEAQTFNNVESAEVSLYEKTILPLASIIFGALERWLSLYYKEKIELKVDVDKIIALESTRRQKAESIKSLLESGVITINEARENLGWDKSKEKNSDKLYISAGKIPLDLTGSIDDYINDTTEDE